MQFSQQTAKQLEDVQKWKLQKLQHEFIIKHVPRLHRLIMEKFPATKGWFNYMIASEEKDPFELTLIRGNKVIARNFERKNTFS